LLGDFSDMRRSGSIHPDGEQIRAKGKGELVLNISFSLLKMVDYVHFVCYLLTVAPTIRSRRIKMATQVDVSKAVATIKIGLPNLTYPIANRKALLEQIRGKTFTGPLKGKQISASEGVKHIPASSFPITSASDFDAKTSSLIASHATKKGFSPINPIKGFSPIKPIEQK
jgi:hypothetical protein